MTRLRRLFPGSRGWLVLFLLAMGAAFIGGMRWPKHQTARRIRGDPST